MKANSEGSLKAVVGGMFRWRRPMAVAGLLMATLLNMGCWGGDVNTPPISGNVLQGQVSGATVWADRLTEGTRMVMDAEEAPYSDVTDTSGHFDIAPIDVDYYGQYVIVSKGGVDTLTNRPAIQMMAPAGSTNISALTTLVALAPAAQQEAVKQKIEAVMGGKAFDSDIAVGATPAALALAKSVETAIEAITQTVSSAAAPLSATTISSVQAQVAAAIAVEVAKPATTAAALATVAGIQTTFTTAVAEAVRTIDATNTNISVGDSAAVNSVATAVATSVATVATAVATEANGGTPTASLSTQTAAIVPEATVVQPLVKELSAAVNDAATIAAETVSVVAPPVVADTTRPTIVAATPAANATDVSAYTQVTVTFSEAMDPASLTSDTLFLSQGATKVAAVITYNATTKTAILTPAAPLTANATYVLNLTTGVRDLSAGLGLASAFSRTFQTAAAADIAAPTVTAKTPAAGATGVAADEVITVTFNEGMTAATLTAANLTVKEGTTAVSGVVRYDAATNTAIFDPSLPLKPNTTYNASVTNAADLAGNVLAAPAQWIFTTQGSADVAAPTVTFTAPAAGATGVARTQVVTASISDEAALDLTTVTGATFTLTTGSAAVTGTVSYNAVTKVATFTPSAALNYLTTYVARISGVKDAAGNTAPVATLTFTTLPSPTGSSGTGGGTGL